MVKLAAGARAQAGGSTELAKVLEQVLHHIEAEDDHALANLSEALSTHPMMVWCIEELGHCATSPDYHRLQALMECLLPDTF